jgi:hypothetical protein
MTNPYLIITGEDFPLTFHFERRRYGTSFYCWAYVLNGREQVSLGDPWPGSQWPRRELMPAAMVALMGKVIVPAAICGECGEFRYHRQGCGHWRPAVEIRAGVWESVAETAAL